MQRPCSLSPKTPNLESLSCASLQTSLLILWRAVLLNLTTPFTSSSPPLALGLSSASHTEARSGRGVR